MLPPVFNTLQAALPVTAIVGNRVFRHGTAPQGVRQPYVTWFAVNVGPENTLSETPAVDRVTIQLDIWCGGSDGDALCEQAAEAIRDAIETVAHVTNQPIDARDPQTKLWRHAIEADWFFGRPA
jgi:hypothetical protein